MMMTARFFFSFALLLLCTGCANAAEGFLRDGKKKVRKNKKCPCGEPCKRKGVKGVCQTDERTCAVNIRPPDCPVDCRLVKCANAVEEPGKCYGIPPGGCCTHEIPCSCPCGELCLMQGGGGTGVCQTDGTTCAVNVLPPDCPVDCSLVLCAKPEEEPGKCYGVPEGKCCPTEIPCPCPCGELCKMEGGGGTGVCQTDGTTCAVNIVAPDCPVDCSLVLCPKPVEEPGKCYGVPEGKCCPTEIPCPCNCGDPCKMEGGGQGVCQTDGETCAVNVLPPDCPIDCRLVFCPFPFEEFGKCYGTPEGECCRREIKCPCPCGDECKMENGGGSGVCQTDGTTCAVNIVAPDCNGCFAVLCPFVPQEPGKCYGVPEGECCVQEIKCPCPCGDKCENPDGSTGVCQTDGTTCAVNVLPPDCDAVNCAAVLCLAIEEEEGKCYGVPEGECCTIEMPCACKDEDGVIHEHGDQWMVDCNTCFCHDGDIACTEIACGGTCVFDGVTYQEGDTWYDGCNTCGCSGGYVRCTLRECDLQCPKVEGPGICVELCSSAPDENDCPDGQLCCSNGCGHVCMDGV